MRRLVQPNGRKRFSSTAPMAVRDAGRGAAQPSALSHCTGAQGTRSETGAPEEKRAVSHGRFLHPNRAGSKAVGPGGGGVNLIIAVREFTAGNIRMNLFPPLSDFQCIYQRTAAQSGQSIGSSLKFGRSGEGDMQDGFFLPHAPNREGGRSSMRGFPRRR